eukprot:Amastigsp_a516477_6.p3 type:complete len:160 gc:universal Amastigsp_a516477_6:504-25(-)
MQIAVADVAVAEHADHVVVAGSASKSLDLGDQNREQTLRNRQIVLVRHVAPVRERRRDLLAQAPELLELRLALGDDAVADERLGGRKLHKALDLRSVVVGIGTRGLEDKVVRVRRAHGITPHARRHSRLQRRAVEVLHRRENLPQTPLRHEIDLEDGVE